MKFVWEIESFLEITYFFASSLEYVHKQFSN